MLLQPQASTWGWWGFGECSRERPENDRPVHSQQPKGANGMSISNYVDTPVISVGPRRLPFAAYPTAADTAQHGIQPLPAVLPLVDFERARPYRSRRYPIAAADRLTAQQVMEMAHVVASSFARREAQCRHLEPPAFPSAALTSTRHSDPFGTQAWGTWNKETLLFWFIRLCILTDPASPLGSDRAQPRGVALIPGHDRPAGQHRRRSH